MPNTILHKQTHFFALALLNRVSSLKTFFSSMKPLYLIALLLSPLAAFADSTPEKSGYSLAMIAFFACIAVTLLIFIAMIWSTLSYRKSQKTADNFHKSAFAELAWTVVPMVVLMGIAMPAASVMQDLEETDKKADVSETQASDVKTETTDANDETVTTDDTGEKVTKEASLELGEKIFMSTCSACHGATGAGIPGAFPAITGSEVVNNPDTTQHIDTVLNGVAGTAMQAFGKQFDDNEIAAVITYQRNALGNSEGTIVQPSDIKAAR